MPARPPFPRAIGVRADPDLPDRLVADASAAVGVVGLATADRLKTLGLSSPRRVDVHLHAGNEVPGMPGMGGQTEFLSRRQMLIHLALDAGKPWDDLKLIMLCHEFGHVVAGSLPFLTSEDLAYIVEEYLAEREAWDILWRSAADPDETTFATLARVHYEGGLETAIIAWRRARANLAAAIAAGDGRVGVRRFEEALYSVVRLLVYGIADAQRAGVRPVIAPGLPGYVVDIVAPLLAPLESIGAGGPLDIVDFPRLQAAFAGLPTMASTALGDLVFATIRRMSGSRQEMLLTSNFAGQRQ